MLLVVLLLISKAGAVCVRGPQELQTDDVLVMCHLSEDARKTRRGVVIIHSNLDQPIPDIMLGCVWPERDAQKPDCRTHSHFTLVTLQKDCLMARVPRAQLHKDGFYQSQLVPPPHADHAFSRCLVFDNDDTVDPSTTIYPVIPTTADELRHPRNDTEKVSTSADGASPLGNSAAGVTLTVLMVILIVLIVGFFAYISLHKTHWREVLRWLWNYRKREQQSRTTVPQTSDNVQEVELQLITTVPQTSETSQEMEQQAMSATPECGRSRERPSPEGLTGEQPKPTNLTETKALLKMGQNKC